MKTFEFRDLTIPYDDVDPKGIEYTVCKDFKHLSRYRRLRQVIHYLENGRRFVTLETQNGYSYEGIEVEYYTVTSDRENRLDLISNDFYNTASYSWVLSYVNSITDGFTVWEGQVLIIPKTISQLFAHGRILSSIPPTSLNLGTE